MKWFRHNSLSRDDMQLLAGTMLMERMQRNRIMLVYEPNETRASAKELGLHQCHGLWHYSQRQEHKRDDDTFEILFEFESDMIEVEQHLTQFKMSSD